MIIGINADQRIEFSCKCDTSEPKTIFVIKPLTGIEMLNLSDLSASDYIFKLFITSIVEIRNWKEGISKEDFIKSLPVQVINEMTLCIMEMNNLTKEDKKKL